MGMNAKPLPRFKLKLIYMLSLFPQPISDSLMIKIFSHAGEEDEELEIRVQEILDEWSRFLRKKNKYGQTFYSLYHGSFREFLHRKDIVQKAGIKLQKIIDMMTDSLWELGFGDE
jgi:hypothetical protein